jgi:hypothetical protein
MPRRPLPLPALLLCGALLLPPVLARPLVAQAGAARTAADTATPVVDVRQPTVLALYAVPPDSLLRSDDGLASLLDDFMYYWADARPRLTRLGVAPLEQALDWRARRVGLRMDGRVWPVELPADSGAVGYVLAAPGRAPRLIPRLLVDEELADSARAAFRRPAP